MPLDARKIAHLKAMRAKANKPRQQNIVLTLRAGGGGTTTLTVPAVWKPNNDADPSRSGSQHLAAHIGGDPDIQASFEMADVTLTQLRACLFAQLQTHGVGAELSSKYVLTRTEVRGIIPGGDHFLTTWTRQGQ